MPPKRKKSQSLLLHHLNSALTSPECLWTTYGLSVLPAPGPGYPKWLQMNELMLRAKKPAPHPSSIWQNPERMPWGGARGGRTGATSLWFVRLPTPRASQGARFPTPPSSPAPPGAPYLLPGHRLRRPAEDLLADRPRGRSHSHPQAEAARKFAPRLALSRRGPAREAALRVPPTAAAPRPLPAALQHPRGSGGSVRGGRGIPAPLGPARRWLFTAAAARSPRPPPCALLTSFILSHPRPPPRSPTVTHRGRGRRCPLRHRRLEAPSRARQTGATS